MDDVAELLLNSALGKELTPKEAGQLAERMSAESLEDDEYLTREGTEDDSLHVIIQGKLEVVKMAGAGEAASLGILRQGELAGELSFIDGAPHVVGLRSLGPARVLSLKRQEFEQLIDSDPQLVYKVMRAIVRSAHRVLSRMNHEFIELSNYIFKQHGRY